MEVLERAETGDQSPRKHSVFRGLMEGQGGWTQRRPVAT